MSGSRSKPEKVPASVISGAARKNPRHAVRAIVPPPLIWWRTLTSAASVSWAAVCQRSPCQVQLPAVGRLLANTNSG